MPGPADKSTEPDPAGAPPSPATPIFAPRGRAALIRGLRILFALVTVAATVIAAYYALILSSSTEVAIGPVRVEFSLKPALHGKSIVDLPPAGSIEADTHSAPAVVSYSLKEISRRSPSAMWANLPIPVLPPGRLWKTGATLSPR